MNFNGEKKRKKNRTANAFIGNELLLKNYIASPEFQVLIAVRQHCHIVEGNVLTFWRCAYFWHLVAEKKNY